MVGERRSSWAWDAAGQDWEKGKTGGGIGQAQGRARATLGSDLDQMMVFSPYVAGSAELDIVRAVESGATQTGWVARGERPGVVESVEGNASVNEKGQPTMTRGKWCKDDWPRRVDCGR